MNDPYHLERFVKAQERVFEDVISELQMARKTSHWMWFVFPQIAGLGQSATSRTYAISSLDEAGAYLAHPVLGPRLLESARIVASLPATTAEQVFGGIDAVKLRSSMTLFSRVAPAERLFREVLDRFFGGQPDEATVARL